MEGCGGLADQVLEGEDIEERGRGDRCGPPRKRFQPQGGNRCSLQGFPGVNLTLDSSQTQAVLQQLRGSSGRQVRLRVSPFTMWGPGEALQTCSEPVSPSVK